LPVENGEFIGLRLDDWVIEKSSRGNDVTKLLEIP